MVSPAARADSQPSDQLDQLRPLDQLRKAVGAVPDPEIPVLTLDDLGILRDVRWAEDGVAEVVLTPTYSGCPATEAIRNDVLAVGNAIEPIRVLIELAPAWTTDWISPDGQRKLAEYGIAPPGPARAQPVLLQLGRRPAADPVACPRCASTDTELVSQFGSTPCKALRRCLACAEPFDEFKAL